MTYQQALDLIQAEIIANGNNEITANVLRPVLEAMIDFPNDVIGALGDLDTSDITSIVNAINSIVSQNLPNSTALRPIDTTGVDFDQDELLWVRDAINNTATNNGAFTCSLGQQMVFYCDVLISNTGGVVTYQTRYYRLTTGAVIVNSLGTGLNPPLMPDGSTINTLELDSDLVIDLGNIGTDNVEDAFNSDGDQPFTISGDKFIQAVQNGDNKLWQWIGGDGTFGNSATLALGSYFVDLTSNTPPPSSIPKYEQIKGGALYQSLTATPSIELNLNSFFYRYIVTDDDLEITFSNLPAPDYGFPRFLDLVIPATKVLTIPSADEIVGSVVADGTTVNRIELRFTYYPTVGLRIVALINGGGSSSGVETDTEAFTNIIKTDKQYFSEGANKGTQTDIINFTVNTTNAKINGGGIKELLSNGDAWLFSGDFGTIATGLTLVDNQIIPDADVLYRLVFYWNGSKVSVAISEINVVVFIPQLNAPVLTDVSEGSGAGELDITFTDTNTSPNETGVEVYYRETSLGGAWTLFGTTSADATSETITGLDDNTEYDVSLIAVGSVGVSNNSVRSNIESGTTPNVVTPLFIDEFAGTSIDTVKWTLTAGGVITINDELIFTEPSPGSGSTGFLNTNGKFNRDFTGVTTVTRIDVVSDNAATSPRLYFGILRTATPTAGLWIGLNLTTTDIRVGHGTVYGGGNFTDVATDLTGSFKIVCTGGVSTFFKWNGTNWGSAIHTGTYNNESHYLQMRMDETGTTYTSGNEHIFTKVAVYGVDFSTLNP